MNVNLFPKPAARCGAKSLPNGSSAASTVTGCFPGPDPHRAGPALSISTIVPDFSGDGGMSDA